MSPDAARATFSNSISAKKRRSVASAASGFAKLAHSGSVSGLPSLIAGACDRRCRWSQRAWWRLRHSGAARVADGGQPVDPAVHQKFALTKCNFLNMRLALRRSALLVGKRIVSPKRSAKNRI